jgi:hypothetical protein
VRHACKSPSPWSIKGRPSVVCPSAKAAHQGPTVQVNKEKWKTLAAQAHLPGSLSLVWPPHPAPRAACRPQGRPPSAPSPRPASTAWPSALRHSTPPHSPRLPTPPHAASLPSTPRRRISAQPQDGNGQGGDPILLGYRSVPSSLGTDLPEVPRNRTDRFGSTECPG